MIVPPPENSQCLNCQHFTGLFTSEEKESEERYRCAAFDSIPYAIMMNRHDHHKPFEGDSGILFMERTDDEEQNSDSGTADERSDSLGDS